MDRAVRSFQLLGLALSVVLFPCFVQEDPNVLGRWIGADEDNNGEEVVIEKEFITIAGDRLPLRWLRPGVLALRLDDEEMEFEYAVKGDELSVTSEGETSKYKRAGVPEKKDKPSNPLGGSSADPFARKFEGDGLRVDLTGSRADGYRGTLILRGLEYPAEAKSADGRNLSGRFQVQETWYDFTATLDGDSMSLSSGGKTYRLKGEKLAEKKLPNPLGEGPDEAQNPLTVEGEITLQELDNVYDGEVEHFEHPRGWFSFEMPTGWSVFQQADTMMVLNPGLTAADTLDAIISLFWGRLEVADQNQPVGKVLEKHTPNLKQALAQQGIEIGDPEGPVFLVQGKDVPGAVLEFRGKTAQGKGFKLWVASLVKREYWLSVTAVVLDGKEEKFLPKTKRVFLTLEPRPPERNPTLEAALVGQSFTSSSFGKVTQSAFHATYTFAAGGSVTRRLMSNVASQPGLPGTSTDAERTGSYEVAGDIVYLFFDTGQEVGQVIQEAGQVAGIRIGTAEYR